VGDEDPFITLGLYRVKHARISQNGVKKVKDFIDERELTNISWYSGAHFNDKEVKKRRKGYFNSGWIRSQGDRRKVLISVRNLSPLVMLAS